MDHSLGFLKIVDESRARVTEITVEDARSRLASHGGSILIDVREDSEWQAGHAAQAIHVGKGVLERDLEKRFPDPDTEILLYCGGGFRSILAADAAQKMGYLRVFSIAGGYKSMAAAGWKLVPG